MKAASRLPPINCFLLFSSYNNQLMSSKVSLAILLIVMLLTGSIQAVKWQAKGSGMNNTVIAEIWKNLETNLDRAFPIQDAYTARYAVAKDISDRLNARWDPAWNVVLASCSTENYDFVLYGYAFRNQWMWYNGVPLATYTESFATIIVWKDYNCIKWAAVVSGPSPFSTAKKDLIQAELDKMTEEAFKNDVWGITFTMMNNLQAHEEFSSGGYSAIMAQDGFSSFFGQVCMKENGYYFSYNQRNNNPIVASKFIGNLFMFQTR